MSKRSDLALLAAVRDLGPKVQTLALRDHLVETERWSRSIGGLYVDLDRFEQRGDITSEESAPRPECGGRTTPLWSVTINGRRRLIEADAAPHKLPTTIAGARSGVSEA